MIEWLKENWIATYAALLATGHLGWAVRQGRKNIPRIRMCLAQNPDKRSERDPSLAVTHTGSGSTEIAEVGYKSINGRRNRIDIHIITKVLTEGNRTHFYRGPLFPYPIRDVEYFFVIDSQFKEYRHYPNRFTRIKKIYHKVKKLFP